MTPPAAPVVSTAPAFQPQVSAVAAPASRVGKKYLQHDSGYVILVDADTPAGAGFREIAGPSAPQSAAAPAAPQSYSTPQTYSQSSAQYQMPSYTAPAQPQLGASMPVATGGTPPGKKWMQHKSGYRVIVDASTMPGPEFKEIPPPATSPAPSYPAPWTGPTQPVQTAQPSLMAQGPGQPQTFSRIPVQPNPYQPGAPSTYQQPLGNLPLAAQRQLPYQPPTPAGVAPPQMNYQAPVPSYGGFGQAQPAARSAPPGKKYVADSQGMRYLVDQSAIAGPGFRELTDAEASRPTMIMSPQMMQQQGGMQPQMMQQQGGMQPQMMQQQQPQQQGPTSWFGKLFNFKGM
jgi:hypothetical protein